MRVKDTFEPEPWVQLFKQQHDGLLGSTTAGWIAGDQPFRLRMRLLRADEVPQIAGVENLRLYKAAFPASFALVQGQVLAPAARTDERYEIKLVLPVPNGSTLIRYAIIARSQ